MFYEYSLFHYSPHQKYALVRDSGILRRFSENESEI